jgi:preprotein translocase subunit SecE
MMKILDFLKDSYQELKTVQWPTRQEAIRMTIIVVVTSVLVGFLITGIDYLLNIGLSYII